MTTLKKIKSIGKIIKLNLLRATNPSTTILPAFLDTQLNCQKLLGKTAYLHIINFINHYKSHTEAILEISRFLCNIGLPDEAIKGFESLLALEPNHPAIHQYLQTLMCTSPERYDHKYIYNAHINWGKNLTYPEKYTSYPNVFKRNRRLRIGYTCHFITNSTSTTLLLPILKAHVRERVEVFVYSDQDKNQTNDEVRSLVEHWRDTKELDDDTFCEQVREDQIDIMLELNGHCLQNRYRALARKPAPIQISYYNCSSTCGAPGIDYILVGENVKIADLQPYYSEKIFQKKGVYFATIVSSHFPSVSSAPFLKNGYVTFGSFGQGHKVSREQIHLWCAVLQHVPNSRFYMKASALDCPISRSVFEKHFEDGGIDISRITLEGDSDYATLLNSYAKMDIGLDTYPYGGGTTTVEATIQGVPVISLIGERFCSQHGYVNLEPIGHSELLCYSTQEFIEKATKLAADKKRLLHYRQTLRNDFIHSPRANMKLFIEELEDAYTVLWKNYLTENSDEESTAKEY